MVRYLLYPVVRFALWVFFRHLEVRGREGVPKGRPLVLVANHPNVMVDVLLVAALSPGPFPRFLGKTTLFKNPFYTFCLRQLGGIPVARGQDPGARVGRNQDMLREATRTLRSGASLALFPEGLSEAGLRLRPLKPGAARIALRAEEEAGGEAGICIVPVGLTYSAPGMFRSRVLVQFGTAIEAADYLDAYRDNHGEGAQRLTEEIQRRLTALTLHLEDPGLEQTVRDLLAVYGEQARRGGEAQALHQRLETWQGLARAAHHFARTDPGLVQVLGGRLRDHLEHLRSLDLEPHSLPSDQARTGLGPLLLTLALAPLALYGLLNNALPYLIPRLWVRSYDEEPEMWATVKLAVGAVAFPLYYLMRMAVAYYFWGWALALEYGLTLPLSGLLVLRYKEQLLERWPLWQRLAAPQARRRLLATLAAERARLIADLDQLRDLYLSLPPEGNP